LFYNDKMIYLVFIPPPIIHLGLVDDGRQRLLLGFDS
jgi:hypothetical protein